MEVLNPPAAMLPVSIPMIWIVFPLSRATKYIIWAFDAILYAETTGAVNPDIVISKFMLPLEAAASKT